MPVRLLGLLVLAGTTTCPQDEPPTAPTTGRPDVETRMEDHFTELAAIKDAVVDGDREGAVELATWVAAHENPADYPLAWRPGVVRLVEAAQAVAAAGDLPTVATATARLSAACGRCHQAVAARPTFDDAVEPPQDDESRPARMQRHQWAVDRMWEAIVAPSELAWRRGAAGFFAAPALGCADAFGQEEHAQDMQRLCDRLEVLGRRASAATDIEARVRVYGDLLATCAACHRTGM